MSRAPESDDGLTRHVGDVLLCLWDPIGINGIGPANEYDRYVPGVTAMVRNLVFEATIVAHLTRIETDEMGLDPAPQRATRAARALLALREASTRSPDRLAKLLVNADGTEAVFILRRSDELLFAEHIVLKEEDDENGAWSWWWSGQGSRSGFYASVDDVERDVCGQIDWLRKNEQTEGLRQESGMSD